jgi:hypothetical protein
MSIVISYCANYYNDCQYTYKWHGNQLLVTNCVSKCINKTTHSRMLGTDYIATGVTSYHTTNQDTWVNLWNHFPRTSLVDGN